LEHQFPYIVAVGFRDMPPDVRVILEGIDGLDQPVNKLFGIIGDIAGDVVIRAPL